MVVTGRRIASTVGFMNHSPDCFVVCPRSRIYCNPVCTLRGGNGNESRILGSTRSLGGGHPRAPVHSDVYAQRPVSGRGGMPITQLAIPTPSDARSSRMSISHRAAHLGRDALNSGVGGDPRTESDEASSRSGFRDGIGGRWEKETAGQVVPFKFSSLSAGRALRAPPDTNSLMSQPIGLDPS